MVKEKLVVQAFVLQRKTEGRARDSNINIINTHHI